ncbi:hypothetical protein L596_000106 [Steinernema carpocapsae]|uniref:Uncharacterized protein n=1 Tax=Steinernema carpocapsae TaxID=34508 RepID=A0A4U8UI74_STECR|nr:hypothetical protein L596_000106 [Steinernema carpocapsae]
MKAKATSLAATKAARAHNSFLVICIALQEVLSRCAQGTTDHSNREVDCQVSAPRKTRHSDATMTTADLRLDHCCSCWIYVNRAVFYTSTPRRRRSKAANVGAREATPTYARRASRFTRTCDCNYRATEQ